MVVNSVNSVKYGTKTVFGIQYVNYFYNIGWGDGGLMVVNSVNSVKYGTKTVFGIQYVNYFSPIVESNDLITCTSKALN